MPALPPGFPTGLPRLTGRGVALRPFREDDAPAVLAAGSDRLIPLITTVPAATEAAAEPDGGTALATAFVRRQHHRLATDLGYSFAVAEAASDEMVGQAGVWLREADQGRVTLGYWILPAARRRGHATAAIAAATAWAAGLPGIGRVQLFVEPWNEGSWRAAERCGYRREGLLRSWERVGGERRDMYAYGYVVGVDRVPEVLLAPAD